MASKVKQITFPDTLLEDGEARAAEIGIPFSEYVRHLVINDTEQIRNRVEKATPEIEERIRLFYENYKQGMYNSLSSDKEISDFLAKISE